MNAEAPTGHQDTATRDKPPDRATVGRAFLDLIHQVMATAPPRTWVQGTSHPGSRAWLKATLPGASMLLGVSARCETTLLRRAAVLSSLKGTVMGHAAEGAWGKATPATREALLSFVHDNANQLPASLSEIASTGKLPYSEREAVRVQRRTRIYS